MQRLLRMRGAGLALFCLLFALVFFLREEVRSTATAFVPEEGVPAPAFTGADQNGTIHRLSDYRGKWLVLYFFPKAGTPGCTTEACSFRDSLLKLKNLGARVVGVSMDDRSDQEHFSRKYHLPFPLLADPDGTIARSYGAAGGFLNMDHRYTFLINPAGILVKRYLDVDLDRHARQILKDLKTMGARETRS
ncbi:MAG: peroxiredoxin [Nitrospirae bacterium]|jgi:peroxiredoxin Q/BCP|nr:peroxiredoxin [Nitrospirota bacterium]